MSCPSLLPVLLPREEDEGIDSPPWCVDSSELCEDHEERLSLFCLDDLEPLCKQCAAVSHTEHRVYPLTDAATDCREELRASFNGLETKLAHLQKSTQTWEHASSHNKSDAKFTEEQMKKDFESLHQFLREEEAARIIFLRENEEEKKKVLDKQIDGMSQVIKSLEEKIQLIEEQLDANGDGAEYLENHTGRVNSTLTEIRDPKRIRRPLIDVCEHLGNLQYTVWEKMKCLTPYTPVTFDPRTAGWSLKVSPGLSNVRICPGPSQGLDLTLDVSVPDNPTRVHPYSCILAREAFNSGVHCWEVEVGDTSNWTVGVAAQSVSRRTEIKACPEVGLWCISLQDGRYQALTSPPRNLNLDATLILRRIHVRLDWDEGTLDFKDVHTNTNLFTFYHCFTETVNPYFESISLFGGFGLLSKTVDVSVKSDFSPEEDTWEDQEVNDEFSPEESNNSELSTYSNTTSECGHLTEDKNSVICAEREKETKPHEGAVKDKPVKIKPTGKNKHSRPRFSVTYHVSLNRALNFIKKLAGKHEELPSHNNPLVEHP
ncbi:nuclear factor 7%2C brain-like [Xyrichtys novacula]|uniref:Nuclear factor 7, brain-like n=1 Tax=Xyrichtys novacula TaxID=13765 RepID=A0AAV1EXA7_XYRNO|nr:nuclear factor 7%2C brain-like [Xyrichtys novacula]